MLDAKLSSSIDVRNAGLKVLHEALESGGMVKFMQQYDMGYGDYAKKKQEQQGVGLEEINMRLRDIED